MNKSVSSGAWHTLGVEFRKVRRVAAYGTVAVFNGPFGKKWDLLRPVFKQRIEKWQD